MQHRSGYSVLRFVPYQLAIYHLCVLCYLVDVEFSYLSAQLTLWVPVPLRHICQVKVPADTSAADPG